MHYVMNAWSTGALALLLGAAAWSDIRSHRIPNVLVLLGLITGLLLQMSAEGMPGLVRALLGMVVGFLVLMPFYLLRTLGAGDVKLMAAVGALMGPAEIVGVFLATLLAGGLMALVQALRAKMLREVSRNVKLIVTDGVLKTGRVPALDQLSQSAGRLPYGVAIALGALGYLIWRHM